MRVYFSEVTHLTYNTEVLFQSQADFEKILAVLKAERSAFNEASVIHYGDGSKRKNSVIELHAKFYRQFRDKNPGIPSQIVIRAQAECLSSYRSVKSNKHRIVGPINKKNLSMRLDKRIYTYKKGKILLTSLEKRVTVDFKRYAKLDGLLAEYEFCDPLLFFRNDKIWIAFTFEVNVKPEPLNKLATGIDLGVNRAIATSEGQIYIDKKFNKDKRKLRFLKRQLQAKGTKSAKRHLFKIRHKEANKNRNQSHVLANLLIRNTKGNTLVLEDLTGLKNAKTKKKKMSRSNNNKIGQVPFAELKRILTYKAPIYGKTVRLINPRFTSQIDSRTGLMDGQRKGSRYYCKDGTVLDADVNAAINIAGRSKLPVSFSDLAVTGLDGQASVNKPNVYKPLSSK